MPTNVSQLKMSATKMVFCFEKLGRMVSHSLHLATVVRGRIGGGWGGRGREGVRCIHLGHSHPTSTKSSKIEKKHLYLIQVFFVIHTCVCFQPFNFFQKFWSPIAAKVLVDFVLCPFGRSGRERLHEKLSTF